MIRSSFRDQGRASRAVRLGCLILSASAAYPGVWALFWPRSFFLRFPGFGYRWVASAPPYNEHLITDVGSFYLGFAVLLFLAALIADRRVIRVSLLSWLVFSIPHVIWHARHVTGDSTMDRWGSVIALGAGAALSLVLLLVGRRR
ncbi:MAG: hypothetical protein LC808_32775 [Actinobacteria bacterium]|nr:hypothetical protein [Actinomycetota bacterium]